MIIRQATRGDIKGVLSLLGKYHVNSISPEDKKDGFVTTNIDEEKLQELIDKEDGITVAVKEDCIVGFALAASWDFWIEWPFYENMVKELPKFSYNGQTLSTENSYQYGPICVDGSVRGQGVFEAIFKASLKNMSARYGYPIMATFVNQINGRSYTAHTQKAGMDTIGTFNYNGNAYYLLACKAGQ